VQQTYIGSDPNFSTNFDLNMVTADNGSLVCVFDRNASNDLVILYDAPSGESWPRLRDNEVSYQPSVRAKWDSRHARLKKAYPGIPEIY
jgi:hypothetical protein